jgi:hypothetical protein
LRYYSNAILNRNIFSVVRSENPFTNEEIRNIKTNLLKTNAINITNIDDVILLSQESNISYSTKKEAIKILKKNGEVIPINNYSQNLIDSTLINKYFLCFPKIY